MGFKFTKLTTHGAFNSAAEVFVDGVSNSTFSAPNNGSATAPAATTIKALSFGSSVYRLIEVVWPYGDSLDFLYIRVNSEATVTAPTAPRPAAKICVLGDSITQGFSLAQTSQSWSYKLGELKGRQIVNLGYGGRTAVGADGSAVASTGCASVFYMIGTNDFNGQRNVADFQASVRPALPDDQSGNPRLLLPDCRG